MIIHKSYLKDFFFQFFFYKTPFLNVSLQKNNPNLILYSLILHQNIFFAIKIEQSNSNVLS
jgi:hypothetical protein